MVRTSKHSDVRDLVLEEMKNWGTFGRTDIMKVLNDLDLGWNTNKVKNQTATYLKYAMAQGLVRNVGRSVYEYIGNNIDSKRQEKEENKTTTEQGYNSMNNEVVSKEQKVEDRETVSNEDDVISQGSTNNIETINSEDGNSTKERVSRKGRTSSKEDKDAESLKLLDDTLATVKSGIIKNSNDSDNPQIRLALGLVQEIFEVVGHKPLNVLEMSNDDFLFYTELNKSLIRLEEIMFNYNESKKRGRAFVL